MTKVEVRDSDRLEVDSSRGRSGPASTSLRPAVEVINSMAREYKFKPKFRVSITSEVPAGAGLGSSASAMVALVSAVSEHLSLRLGVGELIDRAMVGERVIHGQPSGIDTAICGEGGVILYRRGSEPRKIVLEGQRRFLIVNSGRSRRTKSLIRRVAEAKAQFPNLFSGLADSVSEMGETAADRLKSGDMEGLGRLLTLNHAALRTIGVSTTELDQVVDELISLGCYGAKLTGAGGGGSVLAVMPEVKEKSIISELRELGLEAFVSVIPVGGVRSWQEP
jgi:mevalonate kinase